MATYDTFMALRDFVKGKISEYDLKYSDESISDVRSDRSNPGQSKVYIDLSGDDAILSMMGLSDDDIWFHNVINSHYSDYEFMDWYAVQDDFKEGYIIYNDLDEENIEKLRVISRFIYPKKFDLGNDDFKSGLSKKLLELFNDETEQILSDFQSEKNTEMAKSAREAIDTDLEKYFTHLGLGYSSRYDTLNTTVANLIMWYIKTNSLHLPLKELLPKIFEDSKPDRIGNWHETQYEYQNDDYFDSDSFNSYAGRKLDEILEKIQEGAEGEFDFEEYKEMVERVSKKFEIEKWYKLPKKKDTDFKIEGYEMNPNKIMVKLRKGMKARGLKLTEENFYHLLYQPTLFNLEEI